MFRFDFKDKGMIPPILGTDNTDYLERLCPVLERERIHPSGVVRLRDAAFCEERGIEHLSSSAEHTALLENDDYKRLGHRFGMDGDVIRSGLAAFPTCMAVEYGGKVLLFDKTDGGDRMLDAFLSGLAERFFDGKRKPRSLRFYEVAPLDAAYRAKIGDGQTGSLGMVTMGILSAVFPVVVSEAPAGVEWVRIYTGLAGFLKAHGVEWLFAPWAAVGLAGL